jgi:hypothetical protein
LIWIYKKGGALLEQPKKTHVDSPLNTLVVYIATTMDSTIRQKLDSTKITISRLRQKINL